MQFFVSLLLGLALAADCFAVSVCIAGVSKGKLCRWTAPLTFGAFQGAMLVAGFYLGSVAEETVRYVDHWIAFILLAAIGGKLIWESWQGIMEADLASGRNLYLLALATSIDAFVAGFAVSLINGGIWSTAAIVAITTVAVSYLGLHIGSRVKMRHNWAGIAGGIVLILIGLRVLVQHLSQ